MLTVSRSLWRSTLKHLRSCGGGQRECVVFWIGPADGPPRIDEVVHPQHTANRYHYEVDQEWLHALWVRLARDRRSIRAQVHTHAGEAFHSHSDDEGPVIHVPGFLSLVLPDFGSENDLANSFVAEIDRRGIFRSVPIAQHIRLSEGNGD